MVVIIIQLFTQKAFINFGECRQYADWMVVLFSRTGSFFLNIGVTWVILIWVELLLVGLRQHQLLFGVDIYRLKC